MNRHTNAPAGPDAPRALGIIIIGGGATGVGVPSMPPRAVTPRAAGAARLWAKGPPAAAQTTSTAAALSEQGNVSSSWSPERARAACGKMRRIS